MSSSFVPFCYRIDREATFRNNVHPLLLSRLSRLFLRSILKGTVEPFPLGLMRTWCKLLYHSGFNLFSCIKTEGQLHPKVQISKTSSRGKQNSSQRATRQ